MKSTTLYGDDYRYIRKRRRKQAVQRKRTLETSNMVMVYSKIFYIVAILCISLSIATIGALIFMRQYYQNALEDKDAEIAKLQMENEELLNQIDSFSNIYTQTASLLEESLSIAYSLENENEELVTGLNELESELDMYKEREELFDNYEWAIMRSDNTRTDITYSRLTTLEELIDQKGLSTDVMDLILALAMTESQGKENASNPSSTARGFGQFLEGTARFVYEDLMSNGKGSYNHNMAFDGDINIEMMVYYLDYLGIKYSDNIILVLREYRGEDDPKYNPKLNSYLAKADTNLQSIEIHP